MKKLLTTIMFLIFINEIYSQTEKESPNISIDSMLVNLDTTTLISPFLYDRTTPLAALTTFNSIERNIATKAYFEQSLFELYNASNQTLFTTYKTSRQIYAIQKSTSNVEIGFINAEFQNLNFNEDSSKSAIKVEDNKISKINNLPLFNTNTVTIAAPLVKYAVGKTITYAFKGALFFEASNNKIQSIDADFGNNTKTMIYNNGHYLQPNINVNYTTTGYKTLAFKVTYLDGSIKTTYGKLHVKVPESSNKNMPDPLVDDFTLTSTIPFQGYEETSPIFGELEYRVFYHTNNSNSLKTLLKPIVIIDGFDPLDGRKIQDSDPHPDTSDTEHNSIEEIMIYYDNTGDKQLIIPTLRSLGYDVIIVNHPKYTKNINGVDKIIDGGADYIERNGLNHVTLYNHLNSTLLANGSSEELVIVGPSMGGQISRYALSYMEKNNMQHNVRLWVSVDSPHLGANIPVGAQALINTLKENTDSSGATEFVEDWLGSAAAKQQLIEQYSGRELLGYGINGIPIFGTQLTTDYFDAKTMSQGFLENRGHPFFTQFYDNMFTNGLPNSKGYPQNVRSIAIVNGSLTGTRQYKNPFINLSIEPSGNLLPDNYATYGAKALKIKGNEDYLGVHLVTMETYFMANPNLNHKLSYFKKKKLGGWDYYHRYGVNINQRGSLDNIQGGWYPTQRDVAKAIINESPHESILGDFTDWSIGVDEWEIDDLEHVSSFIPTVSALGFTNPEFNWGEYIDTNLLCSDDIPFDSFYAPKINEQHTSFTEESVNWLLAELAGNPQPINGSPSSSSEFLTGPSTLNECQTRQYIAPFVHKVNNYVWTLSGDNSGYCDWEIVSGQGNRIVTIRAGKDNGILTCKPQNSCGTGTLFYKNLRSLEINQDDCVPKLQISPNPNKGEDISIVLKLPPNDPCFPFIDPNELIDFSKYNGNNLWIYDFYGNLIFESLEIKNETIINSSLISKTGIYLIKRLDQYGKTHIGKLIKE